MVRILLLEAHPVVRRVLHRILQTQPDFFVVGEATDGWIALDLLDRLGATVVISEFALPGLNGVEVARCIKRRFPECKVILFSLRDDPVYVTYALAHGVERYISKLAPVDDLLEGIRAVSGLKV